jgi:CDGSH-type Zn-finger protein/uncharacterized Fe-S cluster protein YjdI
VPRPDRTARRTYESDAITVHWDASKCIHTGRCLRALPAVFDTGRRPWVAIDAADADAIAAAVETCPSGALWYERSGDVRGEQPREPTAVVPIPDGPLVVMGDVCVTTPDGDELGTEPRLTLCRCGGTRNPPYCDNSHLARGFRSGDPVAKDDAADLEPGEASTGLGPTTIVPTENGPLELRGRVEVYAPSGQPLAVADALWLCRCGRSKSKPFCDGSHRNGFRSRPPEVPEERERADSPDSFAPNPHVAQPGT